MLQQQLPKHKRKGPTRFPGIMKFTREQGLERTHVWRVLNGERRSPRLMREWEQFTSSAK